MPITYGLVQKQLKLLPIVLAADGSAQVSVRWGYVDHDEFVPPTEQLFHMSPAEVSAVLDAQPASGLSRRDDLAFAIYSHLVAKGLVEPGTIG